MSERFSKTSVATWVYRNMKRLETEHQFDPNNGYAQVAKSTPERIRSYGEYANLRDVLDHFCLWDNVPEEML